MVSLPTLVPNPENEAVFRTLVQDKMHYGLTIDAEIWDAWVAAVNDDNTYNVTDLNKTNKNLFSSYLFYMKCNTTAAGGADGAQYSGCCLESSSDGTVCWIDETADGTGELITYRMTSSQWSTVEGAFSTNQASYRTSMDSQSCKITVGTTTGTEY